tara:strand:- start:6669 stop:7052 length:384 start_codon:yes stop_codon:yes gene_type:complete
MAETFNDAGCNSATTGSTTPTYGTAKASKPVRRVVKLGDGYEQRQMIGLPTQLDPKSYNLNFVVAEADADKIEAFLEARAEDGEYFNWTPPSGSAGKYVCDSWTKSIPYHNRATISATFRQVFDLDS